jgi:phosphoribosylformylglycinamidine cyclo-ligase
MATYNDSGVDIKAGEELVDSIKDIVSSTFNKNVLRNIGAFGGFYEVPSGYKNPVLVSSVDGVGTKLKIAFLADKHDTVGQCLVNHCVNDILVCGAKPLYFMDYFATGKLKKDVGFDIIKGFTVACRENECALIGGETAEMPGFYPENEYDISGTIVGIVDKMDIIDGSSIQKGDVLIGLASNGLHTNGYSLARNVLLKKYNVNSYIDELGMTLAEELLKVHKSYYHQIKRLSNVTKIRGLSHITGGGLIGNTMRVIPEGLALDVDWASWEEPAVFNLIRKEGNVPEEDMRSAFNLGIGLVVIVSEQDAEVSLEELTKAGEQPLIIGKVIKKI